MQSDSKVNNLIFANGLSYSLFIILLVNVLSLRPSNPRAKGNSRKTTLLHSGQATLEQKEILDKPMLSTEATQHKSRMKR